ncbi:MAG TPA: CdaR family protein [Oscillospiraceae bacterium]|nr:CdaR family protein [Oscillospiraceae bacterium]
MSKIYNSKIFWMILSLLASLVLWAYISNQDTTSISKQLTGIQVQFSGEDLLREERNLAISDVDTTSVNVWIRGSRRAIGALDGSQVVAVIDVSKITQAGDMSWSYTIKYPAGTDTGSITTISRSPEIIGFTVSALSSKSVEVAGSFAGSLAEGYSAEDPTFEPSTVTVTGSEAALTKIAGAKVVFGKDKTDVKESFSVDTGYTLVDADGNPVSTTGLTFSTELIKATLPIMEVKELPLSVTLIDGGGATANNCTVSIEPQTIKVAGDSKVLDAMNKLVIGTVDLSDFSASYEDTFPIMLDDDLQNVTGEVSALVKIVIVGLTTKTFDVTNISCSNVAAGCSAAVETETISVTMRGTEAALDALTAGNIRAVADLSNYSDTTGTVMPTAKIAVDGVSGVGAIGSYKVTVTLSKG